MWPVDFLCFFKTASLLGVNKEKKRRKTIKAGRRKYAEPMSCIVMPTWRKLSFKCNPFQKGKNTLHLESIKRLVQVILSLIQPIGMWKKSRLETDTLSEWKAFLTLTRFTKLSNILYLVVDNESENVREFWWKEVSKNHWGKCYLNSIWRKIREGTVR